MKTSADIYSKGKGQRANGKGQKTIKSLCSMLYALCLLFLASCTAARYETVPVKPSDTTVEKSDEKPAEKEQHIFIKFRGDRKHVVASWYGPNFHGKPTSSGELFNMYALTCAHKEYPFGTKLKVVNTNNSKEVECVVNDRGPFIPGRDLDLSYAAAKRIDLIGPGTDTVMIEPIGRDLRYVKYIRYGSSAGTLTIQIGSFRDESNAKRLKTALELNYKNVYIMEANVGGIKYYRVRLGKFPSKDEAVKTGKSLADEGYSVLITKFEQQI
jgi:rare lipoprotein A